MTTDDDVMKSLVEEDKQRLVTEVAELEVLPVVCGMFEKFFLTIPMMIIVFLVAKLYA